MTPAIVGGDALRKMGIEPGSELAEQVFWLEGDRCLRPMLAPNLYTLLRRLARIWKQPFAIFEIGSCFRRDTKGSQHLNEFTMLNVVELGTALDGATSACASSPPLVLGAAGVTGYEFDATDSEVYGDDARRRGRRPRGLLDGARARTRSTTPGRITDPWVGLGFGLERLLTAREGYPDVDRVGRSLSYVDGVRLQL